MDFSGTCSRDFGEAGFYRRNIGGLDWERPERKARGLSVGVKTGLCGVEIKILEETVAFCLRSTLMHVSREPSLSKVRW